MMGRAGRRPMFTESLLCEHPIPEGNSSLPSKARRRPCCQEHRKSKKDSTPRDKEQLDPALGDSGNKTAAECSSRLRKTASQEFKTGLTNMVKPCLYQKYTMPTLGVVAQACNLSTLGGRAPQEAETGNSLEPGVEGGGCSEPRSCHCTPARVIEQDSISKEKERERKLPKAKANPKYIL
ncbi:hypothetical protein AAY473_020067 [Plecturocebus cupreus]